MSGRLIESSGAGLPARPSKPGVTIQTFLAVVGFVYFIAFTSFGVQALGLVGSHGILPYRQFLAAAHTALGGAAYRELPTLLWLDPSDRALAAAWIAGAAAALAAIFSPWRRTALAACLALWLSICVVGQDFLSFQWDVLLLEAGFLAIFADASPVRVWLFRWLIFRLMFFSGAVKLLSGDPTWRDLTALHYHYETQPLPTPAAWLMNQAPMAFQKVSTALVLAAELIVPFLFLLPRSMARARRAGAWIAILLQLLILATGNYTFFNFLTIALAMWLFIEPQGARASWPALHYAVSAALAVFIGVTSGLLCPQLFSLPLPPGGSAVLRAVRPFRIVNSYGLFANMTTERPEIVIEGSNDGAGWLAYEFPYKPGSVTRPPPVIEPYQPRLDWQMWFAALGSYRQNRWFVNLVLRAAPGRAGGAAAVPVQPLPVRSAGLHPRAPVPLSLHHMGPARLVDARGSRPVLSAGRAEMMAYHGSRNA